MTEVPTGVLTNDHLERLASLIHDHAGLLEFGSADEIVGYVVRGDPMPAYEMLQRNALIHESCMSSRRADSLYAVCDEIGRTFAAFGEVSA